MSNDFYTDVRIRIWRNVSISEYSYGEHACQGCHYNLAKDLRATGRVPQLVMLPEKTTMSHVVQDNLLASQDPPFNRVEQINYLLISVNICNKGS
jgi:hypothetical protein